MENRISRRLRKVSEREERVFMTQEE